MKLRNVFSFLMALAMLGLTSCKDDDEPTVIVVTDTIDVAISGLQDLGSDYVYEGWLIVDGDPVSTGTFTVDADGKQSQTEFTLAQVTIEAATKFVLSIEPANDTDPTPSAVKILGGDFGTNGISNLSVGHAAALGSDLSEASGTYFLATPTDSDDNNESSGLWFINIESMQPAVGLNIPTLPAGWAYEGWAVIDGQPVSTGVFTSATGADNSATFSGAGGPPFPGEDFLMNAPTGLTFPTDLRGKTAVISIEPVPDNSPMPFSLKPLVGQIAEDAQTHTVLSLTNNSAATNPTGTVTK